MNTGLLFLYNIVCQFLPATRLYVLKSTWLQAAGAVVGPSVRVVSSAKFHVQGTLMIGGNTFIGHEVMMVGGKSDIKIGAKCDFGPRAIVVTGTHEITPDGDRIAGPGLSLPVTIGDGCWIGANSTLLGGTVLGRNTIVAAGSVVKGEFPERSLIGGVPAKVIRYL